MVCVHVEIIGKECAITFGIQNLTHVDVASLLNIKNNGFSLLNIKNNGFSWLSGLQPKLFQEKEVVFTYSFSTFKLIR